MRKVFLGLLLLSIFGHALLVPVSAEASPTWKYDEYGNLIYYHNLRSYTSHGNLYEYEVERGWEYTYREDKIIGRRVTCQRKRMRNGVPLYSYSSVYFQDEDSRTRLVIRCFYNRRGQMTRKTIITSAYDNETGKTVREKTMIRYRYDREGDLIFTYVYNKERKLVKKISHMNITREEIWAQDPGKKRVEVTFNANQLFIKEIGVQRSDEYTNEYTYNRDLGTITVFRSKDGYGPYTYTSRYGNFNSAMVEMLDILEFTYSEGSTGYQPRFAELADQLETGQLYYQDVSREQLYAISDDNCFRTDVILDSAQLRIWGPSSQTYLYDRKNDTITVYDCVFSVTHKREDGGFGSCRDWMLWLLRFDEYNRGAEGYGKRFNEIADQLESGVLYPQGAFQTTTTYYADTGYLESESFNPPSDGIEYRRYLNEAFDRAGGEPGRIDREVIKLPDGDGARAYVYEYYADTDNVKMRKCYETASYSDFSNPIMGNFVTAYEYFYDDMNNLIRERRYLGGLNVGIVKEYIPGKDMPVKVTNNPGSEVYRKEYGGTTGPTLTMRYYESYPDGSPWGTFSFGENGETVFIKDVMCGTQVKKRLIYMHNGDLDLENDIDWFGVPARLTTGQIINPDTLYEIDMCKYSIYDIDPHFAIGEPDRYGVDYPFTYYSSGRVHTRFEGSTKAGMFTRSEEATETTYEYADESFYSEEDENCFLADLIYYAEEPGSLKNFLTGLDLKALNITTIEDLIAHINDNAGSSNGFTPDDLGELLRSLPLVRPYEEHGRLIKKTNADGTYIVFEYAGDTDTLLEKRTYRIDGALLEKRTALAQSKEFIGMGNLPWIRYGEGIGIRSMDGWHSGYSRGRTGGEGLTGYEELRAGLKKWEGGSVRIFLFADMRSGMMFDANGLFTGFTDYVIEDMEILLNTAKELNIKLIPTLFDYRMADGEENASDHEHIDLIKDETKTKVLLDHFGWFFREVRKLENYDTIYAWDVINEPEGSCEGHLGKVTMEEMRTFVRSFVWKIHEEDADALVTVGSLTKSEMMKNWVIPDNALADDDKNALDFYQFHYYDSYDLWPETNIEDISYNKESLNTFGYLNDGLRYFNAPNYTNGKPVIGGEIDPTYVIDKLDTFANHGYDGIMFWDDKGNILDVRENQAIRDWFSGNVYTYYPDTGLVESERGTGLDDPEFIYRHYNEDGKKDIAVRKTVDEYGVKAYTYDEYWDGYNRRTVHVRKSYHTVEYSTDPAVPVLSDLVVTEEYDRCGFLLPGARKWSNIYYEDSWLMRADLGRYSAACKYYINENWENRGFGREMMESYNQRAYLYSNVGDEYQRYGQWEWEFMDISDPNDPKFSGFLRYSGDWNGSDSEYYNPEASDNKKRLRSRTLPKADSSGNVYYHYINENIDEPWNTRGVPRMDESHFGTANEKGEIAFTYEYYADSTQINIISSYSAVTKDPGDLIAVYEYGSEGKIIVSTVFSGANVKGEKAFEFEYHEGDDSDKPHFIYSYSTTDRDPGDLLNTYEYDTSGNIVEISEGALFAGEENFNAFLIKEINSKNNAIQTNRTGFTGYSMKKEDTRCFISGVKS
ncbi:MAG: hypothetical protein KAI70_02915 [Candidatus Omnitrophica bacterium]|nr:hypothetical protein [Candidatus Omnitrophota bacterium]